MVPNIVKSLETQNRMVIVRGWGKGRIGSYYLVGIEFQLHKMKRVLVLGGGDGCAAM